MNKRSGYMLVACVVFMTVGQVRAQSLEERLQQYGVEYAKGYTAPFGDAFGASLNSGWYHTANVSNGLDIYIGVKAMYLPIPDEARTFNFASPATGVVQTVPTFFGDKNLKVPIDGVPSNIDPHEYASGVDLKAAPMGMPHISVGNIFGTRLLLRILPPVRIRDFGDFSFFGIGVQHSISQWVKALPLDVSALAAYQSMSLSDLVEAKAFTIGVQASKSFSIVTFYGGLGYETSSLTFSYTATFQNLNPPYQQITTPVSFDLSGKNTVRFTGGFLLNLSVIKINADYSFAAQPVATLGLGVGI